MQNPFGRAAKALSITFPGRSRDRREGSRQWLHDASGETIVAQERVLNVSRNGLALEVPAECRFATGEHHRFKLKVASGVVEVEGKVRWTRSVWPHRSDAEESVYVQKAGLDLTESLDQDTTQVWDVLRSMVTDYPIGMEISDSQVVKRFG